MSNQTTCGMGLAANARVPATASELFAALAELLDAHRQALDITDERAKPEHHAYVTLTLECQTIAAQLASMAERMIGYRTLPMGRHHQDKLSAQQPAFERLVQAERSLLSQLTSTLGEHEAMLRQS